MIQIRNVPEDLHRKLKARAARTGLSLSDYLLNEIRRLAELPTLEEMRERLHSLPSVDVSEDPADLIRALRDALDATPLDAPLTTVDMIRKMRDALDRR